jgi:replicative DNA helicase
MSEANFISAASILANWQDQVLSGRSPTTFPVGDSFGDIVIGPGLVALVGGAPGAGKTALVMQWTVDALRLTPALRACVCNVEMPPDALQERQLARLTGIGLTTIRRRQFNEQHRARLDTGFATIGTFADRLCFVRPPFNLANVAHSVDQFHADLIVLDYIQRIPPPGDHGDKRLAIDATMNFLRQFADEGQKAVICVAAVGRTKDNKGRSSYDGGGLNLASFKESGELEFGCDDAFLLVPDSKRVDGVRLRHLKSRYGEPRDLELRFDKARQSFTGSQLAPSPAPAASRTPSLAELWNQTPAAPDDDDGNSDEDSIERSNGGQRI